MRKNMRMPLGIIAVFGLLVALTCGTKIAAAEVYKGDATNLRISVKEVEDSAFEHEPLDVTIYGLEPKAVYQVDLSGAEATVIQIRSEGHHTSSRLIGTNPNSIWASEAGVATARFWLSLDQFVTIYNLPVTASVLIKEDEEKGSFLAATINGAEIPIHSYTEEKAAVPDPIKTQYTAFKEPVSLDKSLTENRIAVSRAPYRWKSSDTALVVFVLCAILLLIVVIIPLNHEAIKRQEERAERAGENEQTSEE